MIVMWILVLISLGVLALILGHFFGAQITNTTKKIYKDFTEEEEKKENEQ